MICGNLVNIVSLEYKGCKGKVSYSKDDKIYYGCITNIKDTVGSHAPNICLIEEEFRNTVDDYIEFRKECGKND